MVGGVQSSESSKTVGKSSSSEMMKDVECEAAQACPPSEDPCGQDG